MNNNNSKYSHDDRKNIVRLIGNLKNNEDYVAIFEILTSDPVSYYSTNSTGVFLNLSTTSDETLNKVNKYIQKVTRKRKTEVKTDYDIIPNSDYSNNDRTYKLSNYEKNILKQRNLKKILNEDNEYEELKICAQKPEKPMSSDINSGSSSIQKSSTKSTTNKLATKRNAGSKTNAVKRQTNGKRKSTAQSSNNSNNNSNSKSSSKSSKSSSSKSNKTSTRANTNSKSKSKCKINAQI